MKIQLTQDGYGIRLRRCRECREAMNTQAIVSQAEHVGEKSLEHGGGSAGDGRHPKTRGFPGYVKPTTILAIAISKDIT